MDISISDVIYFIERAIKNNYEMEISNSGEVLSIEVKDRKFETSIRIFINCPRMEIYIGRYFLHNNSVMCSSNIKIKDLSELDITEVKSAILKAEEHSKKITEDCFIHFFDNDKPIPNINDLDDDE